MGQARSPDLFGQTAQLLGADTDNDDIGTGQGGGQVGRKSNVKRHMKVFILTL